MVQGMSKVIGAGTTLLALTAISKNAATYGLAEAKAHESEELTDTFMKQNTGDGDILKSGVKNWWWKVMLDQKLLPTYYKIKDVGIEAVKQTANYALPLGLAIGAMAGGAVIAPLCVGGLALLGARAFLCDIVGIGEE